MTPSARAALMDATLIVIDSDAELARALKLVETLLPSDDPADVARLAAQARLIAGYEQTRWQRGTPRTADVIRYLMGSARAFARRHGADPRHREPRQRGVERKERAEHDDGAAATRAVPRAGECAAAAGEEGEGKASDEAEGGVSFVARAKAKRAHQLALRIG